MFLIPDVLNTTCSEHQVFRIRCLEHHMFLTITRCFEHLDLMIWWFWTPDVLNSEHHMFLKFTRCLEHHMFLIPDVLKTTCCEHQMFRTPHVQNTDGMNIEHHMFWDHKCNRPNNNTEIQYFANIQNAAPSSWMLPHPLECCPILLNAAPSSWMLPHPLECCPILLNAAPSSWMVPHPLEWCPILLNAATSSWMLPHPLECCHILLNAAPSIINYYQARTHDFYLAQC